MYDEDTYEPEALTVNFISEESFRRFRNAWNERAGHEDISCEATMIHDLIVVGQDECERAMDLRNEIYGVFIKEVDGL